MNPLPDININADTQLDLNDSCNCDCPCTCCILKSPKHDKTCAVSQERFDKDFERLKHTQSAPAREFKIKKEEK